MKKIIWLICMLFCITGCNSKRIQSYQEITYSEYIEKIENKDTFVLFMWQTGCSHCEDFKPILEKIIREHKISNIYSINLENLTSKEYAKLKNKTFISGTPTTIYIKDGVTQTSPKIIGNKDEKLVIKFFKQIDYIGED